MLELDRLLKDIPTGCPICDSPIVRIRIEKDHPGKKVLQINVDYWCGESDHFKIEDNEILIAISHSLNKICTNIRDVAKDLKQKERELNGDSRKEIFFP